MHIFIDESGQPIPSAKDPVACVTALVVPDSQIDKMNQWFLSIETEYGKPIKGKEIDQSLRNKILKEVLNFDVFVECTAIDMELHSTDVISQHKEKRATFIETALTTQNPYLQAMRTSYANRIIKTSNQLYLQAILNWHLIELILRHGTIYYSQKRPKELAAFHWIIDPKQAGQVIPFENLWTELVLPYLQCQPSLACIEGHDYSYLERFAVPDAVIDAYHTDSGKKLRKEDMPLDLKKMITEHLSFPDDQETPGLRLVDVISNSIFQCLNRGPTFQEHHHIGPLFFMRRPSNCISLQALFDVTKEKIQDRPYKKALLSIDKKNRPIWLS